MIRRKLEVHMNIRNLIASAFVALLLLPACTGTNSQSFEFPLPGEIHVRPLSSEDAAAHSPEEGDYVAYDIAVPSPGTLHVSICDRGRVIIKTSGPQTQGIITVVFGFRAVAGKEVVEEYLAPLLSGDERELLDATFPGLEERSFYRGWLVTKGPLMTSSGPVTLDNSSTPPEYPTMMSYGLEISPSIGYATFSGEEAG
jgi:hypothetical protein